MRRFLAALLLGGLLGTQMGAQLGAQEEAAEPGLVPTTLVDLEKLRIPPCEGDARKALDTFLEAHRKHEAGDLDGAVAGYVAFLGMPGRLELPARYTRIVERRVSAVRAEARAQYLEATELYGRDRAKGLGELKRIAARYGPLPEGQAARALWHSDALRAAILKARTPGAAKEPSARELEGVIRAHPAGLYLYEAKRLLVELGGPDLFAPGERIAGDAEAPEGTGSPEKDGEKPDIIVSED